MDIINHTVRRCLDLFDVDAERVKRRRSNPNT